MVWTLEKQVFAGGEQVKDGSFATVERRIHILNPGAGREADTGATPTESMVIRPERPYHTGAELNPPGFRDMRKFVVSENGRIIPA